MMYCANSISLQSTHIKNVSTRWLFGWLWFRRRATYHGTHPPNWFGWYTSISIPTAAATKCDSVYNKYVANGIGTPSNHWINNLIHSSIRFASSWEMPRSLSACLFNKEGKWTYSMTTVLPSCLLPASWHREKEWAEVQPSLIHHERIRTCPVHREELHARDTPLTANRMNHPTLDRLHWNTYRIATGWSTKSDLHRRDWWDWHLLSSCWEFAETRESKFPFARRSPEPAALVLPPALSPPELFITSMVTTSYLLPVGMLGKRHGSTYLQDWRGTA